jgi:hypothetical protein
VSLGYDIANALPGLRAEAESRMTENVTVGIFEDGTDETTGDPTRVLVLARYTGKGRIRWGSREVMNANGPGGPVTVQEPYLSIPFGSPRLFDRDEVLVTASTSDPILVGRTFNIQGDVVAGQTTAHKYPLLEV